MLNTKVPRISLHDFNDLEGLRLKGFLNIKGKGLFPRTPFLDREGLMSGSATGISFGDEQDCRGEVFENQLEKRQVYALRLCRSRRNGPAHIHLAG